MQLNPARGRKHVFPAINQSTDTSKVYAAQPREGTETRIYRTMHQTAMVKWFMQLNPARGRKPQLLTIILVGFRTGLCSSTPRGDGNSEVVFHADIAMPTRFMQLNPARGRKHDSRRPLTQDFPHRFMQLNPARGRKLCILHGAIREHILEVYAAQPREGTET